MGGAIDGGTGGGVTIQDRRIIAAEIWLDAQKAVMDEREAKGLPVFGLKEAEKQNIETEVALVAGMRVANLALDHFMDTTSRVAQPGVVNG
jgi:hypothetical protein